MLNVPSPHPHTLIQYTSEPPTPIGIDMFFFLPWLSGQQVVDTGRAELPTHWIFIKPQITETTGMCSFISTAKPPAMRITQQPHSPAILIAQHSPFPLSFWLSHPLFSFDLSLFFFSHSVFYALSCSLACIPLHLPHSITSLSCMSHRSLVD